jgi:hypothetical protein
MSHCINACSQDRNSSAISNINASPSVSVNQSVGVCTEYDTGLEGGRMLTNSIKPADGSIVTDKFSTPLFDSVPQSTQLSAFHASSIPQVSLSYSIHSPRAESNKSILLERQESIECNDEGWSNDLLYHIYVSPNHKLKTIDSRYQRRSLVAHSSEDNSRFTLRPHSSIVSQCCQETNEYAAEKGFRSFLESALSPTTSQVHCTPTATEQDESSLNFKCSTFLPAIDNLQQF